MSNNNEWYDDDDDLDTDDDSQDGGLKNLRKADRAKSKMIKELQTELDGLRKFQRESVVGSVLKDKGVNPKIAAFIPADVASDAEAISNWLTEHGDVFGVNSAPQQTEQSTEVDRNLAALRQIDNITNSSISPDDVNDVFSRLNGAGSAEEIIAMINGF
jgi:hypothetical protein